MLIECLSPQTPFLLFGAEPAQASDEALRHLGPPLARGGVFGNRSDSLVISAAPPPPLELSPCGILQPPLWAQYTHTPHASVPPGVLWIFAPIYQSCSRRGEPDAGLLGIRYVSKCGM